MTDPRTTVVVITHNRCLELLHTLDHLAELPERPRVIVTDNGSSDGTATAVAASPPRGAAAAPRPQPRCRRPQPGHAPCAHTLRRLLRRRLLVGARGPHRCRRPARPAPRARRRDSPHRRRTGRYGRPDVTELRDSPIPGPSWLPGPALGSFLAAATVLRADAFRVAGGFHPRLWLGGEEELLAADLAADGWRLTYADHLTAHHHPSVARDATLRRVHGIRNALWFTWLRRPAGRALRRTLHLARTVPRDTASLHAFAEAAAALPWVLRERRVLPAEVESRLRLPGGCPAPVDRPPVHRLSGAASWAAPLRGIRTGGFSRRSRGVRPSGRGRARCEVPDSATSDPVAGSCWRRRWRPGRKSRLLCLLAQPGPLGVVLLASGLGHDDHLLVPGAPRLAGRNSRDADGCVHRHSSRRTECNVRDR